MTQTLPPRVQARAMLSEHVKQRIEGRLVALSHGAYDNLDWEQAAQELCNPALVYPTYYLVPHHGFAEGYLSNSQALGWAFVEHFFRVTRALPSLLDIASTVPPQHIVDPGCGVATASLALAQRFPHAHLTLLDLSPYQLAAARRQARVQGLSQRTTYIHASAEQTGLPSNSVDLVMSTLLFHELPRLPARAVAREVYRILAPGGRFVEFDPIQHALPWTWADRAVNRVLAALIREVYWMDYMKQPVWEVCQDIGFQQVQRRLIVVFPWVYQVISATK
jgi:ubiquinone/menaquinone biosynthesis C-methylase UbiE